MTDQPRPDTRTREQKMIDGDVAPWYRPGSTEEPRTPLTGEALYREYWRMQWADPKNVQRQWEQLPATQRTLWGGLAAFAAARAAAEPTDDYQRGYRQGWEDKTCG